MTQQQIAVLELALVTGLGAVLFIAGILIKVFTNKKTADAHRKRSGKWSGTHLWVPGGWPP